MSQKQYIVVGNMKMSLETVSMRDAYMTQAREDFHRLPTDIVVVLCPPTVHITSFVEALKDTTISFGAQDCFWEMRGSYTGQTSPKALVSQGMKYVIVGHSERRALGEENEDVTRKTVAALRAGLFPIVCVGYSEGSFDEITAVQKQVRSVIADLAIEDMKHVIFAYEPVWAIGSGRSATAEDIYTMILIMRKEIAGRHALAAQDTRILYGGSVSDENVRALCQEAHVDGFLVGGASLHSDQFLRIARIVMDEQKKGFKK